MNILISRCLLGESVRWHGKQLRLSSYLKQWLAGHPDVNIFPVCPELLGGLGVPRPPVKRKNGRVFITCPDKKARKYITGQEVTEAFLTGARSTLKIATENKCTMAILCKWSPSCDKTGITGKLLALHNIEIINTF